LPLIDDLLRGAEISLSDVGAFAVTLGPGSFTGLRIGLATVKGLVYGSKIPVIGVPTLHAVAARVDDHEGFVCPFLDARKKEVYAALFRREGELMERVSDDVVAPPEAVLDAARKQIGSARCLFIGDAIVAYEALVQAALGPQALSTLGADYPSTAAAVARIAGEKLSRGDYDAVGPLAPIYLRPSEAELKKPL
ncbi:MAG TPA: tRNA (adenosine(37)-N6)-threonylcarbamoyltransferase complex dimerization subunit type 1 TsaB, partial [Candidatus Binatia bacterium]|nr:tRNA (adenosine(37)-N6)-threonylcarbamoyltransferase complex dimerization subunit type 1 TsaB [Candidatus Binatia bacterium]